MTLTRLRAYAPNGADQGAIPTPQGLSAGFPLNDVGALTWSYPSTGPRAASALGQPIEVAVQVSTDLGATWTEPPSGRFLYYRDGRDPVKDEAFSIECPAYVIRLRKGLVFPTGLDTDGKRHFTDASPGQILNTLLSEAQARGALVGLAWDFSAATDSGGVAWPAATRQTIAYDPGTDFLTILQGFADLGLVDYRTQGRTLQMYAADTTTGMAADRTIGANPVSLRFGRDLTEAPFRRTWEGLADTALVIGDNVTFVERTNGGAITPWGRQETYVAASGVQDTGTLTTLADGALSLTEAARIERTYGLDFTQAKHLPFRDYGSGEWVFGSTEADVAPERMRVRQITLTMDDNGVAGGNVVLNDRFTESDIATARRLDKMLGGATSATTGTPGGVGNDILAPGATGAVTGSTTAYIGPDGFPKATITLDWPDVLINADGTAITDLDHYEVHRRRQGEVTWTQVAEVNASTWSDSPYEPNETWEFQVRAVDTVYNRGAFSAVEAVTTAQDVDPPETPSAPTLTSNTKGIIQATWDGLTATAGAMDADLDRIEVHASAVNDFPVTPGDLATLVGSLKHAGSMTFAKPVGTTWHVKFVAVDSSANASPASAQGTTVVSVGTDGAVPVIPGGWAVVLEPFAVGGLQVSWDAVPNADRVTYDVYVDAGAAVAVFDATTYVGSTQATSFGINALANGALLNSTTQYYVAVKVRDDDGPAVGTGTAGPVNVRTATADDIAAEYVYAGAIQAEQIAAGTLSADLALAARIYTAATGRRVTLSSDGLTATDDVGNIVFQIPTDMGLNTSINTDVIAQSITALGSVAMRSTLNEIAKGAVLILRAGTTAPVSPPSVAIDWNTARFAPDATYANWNYGGTYDTGSGLAYTAGVVSGYSWILERTAATGVTLNNWSLDQFNADGSHIDYYCVGVARIANSYWTLGYYADSYKGGNPWNPHYFLTRWARDAIDGHPIHLADYEVLAAQDMVNLAPALGYQASTGYLIVAYPDKANANKITALYWDPATTAAHHVRYTAVAYAGGLGAVMDGVFDYSGNRLIVTSRDRSGGDKVWTFNNAGTPASPWAEVVNDEFATAYNDKIAALFWDGAASLFRHYSRADNVVYTYDGTNWAGVSPETWKVTTTWYDNDATGGTHESAQGPAAAVAMKKRARLTVTAPNIPSNDDPADHDDANAVRIYVGNGDGAYNHQWRQASPATGVRTASIVQAVFSNADTLHPNPPQFGDFPASTAGKITDDTGAWFMDGNGEAALKVRNTVRQVGAFSAGSALVGPFANTVAGNVASVSVALVAGRKYRVVLDATISPGTGGQYATLDLKHGVGATTGGTLFRRTYQDFRLTGRVQTVHVEGDFVAATTQTENIVGVITGQGGTTQTYVASAAEDASRMIVEEILL